MLSSGGILRCVYHWKIKAGIHHFRQSTFRWYMLTCTVGREKAVGRFALYVGETNNKKGGVSPYF